MAKLLLITAKQLRTKNNKQVNNIGDIVGVYEDSHKFTDGELDSFSFKSVPGTVAEVETELKKLLPSTDYEKMDHKKYAFRVTDDTKTEIKDIASSNLILKVAEVK